MASQRPTGTRTIKNEALEACRQHEYEKLGADAAADYRKRYKLENAATVKAQELLFLGQRDEVVQASQYPDHRCKNRLPIRKSSDLVFKKPSRFGILYYSIEAFKYSYRELVVLADFLHYTLPGTTVVLYIQR